MQSLILCEKGRGQFDVVGKMYLSKSSQEMEDGTSQTKRKSSKERVSVPFPQA